MMALPELTQRNYKRGWKFIFFFIRNYELFLNWNNEDECIIIFGDFILLFSSNNKISELNIACSVISKMFQFFQNFL
jgi:hypothetical protein